MRSDAFVHACRAGGAEVRKLCRLANYLRHVSPIKQAVAMAGKERFCGIGQQVQLTYTQLLCIGFDLCDQCAAITLAARHWADYQRAQQCYLIVRL